jgi:hypothetical protein
LEGFHPIQHLAAIRGFADDLNVLLLRQEPAEPFPEDGMSVSNEYCDQVHSGNVAALHIKTVNTGLPWQLSADSCVRDGPAFTVAWPMFVVLHA